MKVGVGAGGRTGSGTIFSKPKMSSGQTPVRRNIPK